MGREDENVDEDGKTMRDTAIFRKHGLLEENCDGTLLLVTR